MARKKKASVMKRNKQAAAGGAATTEITKAKPAVPTTAGGDRMDVLLADDGQRITYERVIKYMPDTAQRLKEGSLSEYQFAEDVFNAILAQFRARGNVLFNHIFYHIAAACWPGPTYSADANEYFKKIAGNLYDAYFEEYDEFKDLPGEAFCEAATVVLQRSAEKICRTLSAQLDRKFFHGVTGTFLRWCPIYGASSAKEFTDAMRKRNLMLTEELTKAQNTLRLCLSVKRDAFLASFVLASRAYEVWEECWECGKKTKRCPFCARCSVARYCGLDCQVQAWGQHKEKCARNKKLHGVFLANLCIIEEAHNVGTMHGVKLNFMHDGEMTLRIMCEMTLKIRSLRPQCTTLPVEGPSMEFFYENIGHIVRGDWWLWEATETLEQFSGKFELLSSAAIRGAVEQVSVLLAYNLHAYAASTNDAIVSSKTIEAVVMEHPYGMLYVGMPVAFFLKFYNARIENIDSLCRQKIAHVLKARALTYLKKRQSDI